MSITAGVWTIEEIDAQITNIKSQLLASNASYSISPADGGAGRSVSRNDREKLNAELTLWMKRRKSLSGAGSSRGGFRVRRATFPRNCR